AAAALVGCSESVASRELAAALESLRRFLSRHGVTVSGTAFITLLPTHGAQASIGTATVAATLSSASAVAGTCAFVVPLTLELMKPSTPATIIVAVAAALLITSGTVYTVAHKHVQSARTKAGAQPAPAAARADKSQSKSGIAQLPAAAVRP